MNRKEWLIMGIYVTVIVLVIVLFILYVKGILSADIPWWLKMFLLKSNK